jgi:hypothetical protein
MTFLYWYGGLFGVGVAALLVLWALGLIAIKQSTDHFAARILLGGLLLAVAGAWAVTHATRLNQGNQLVKVHEPLMRLVAGSVSTRGALDDLRAVAEPSAALTALLDRYDGRDASIANLLQAEWQYYRGAPWDERGLLYKMTWDVSSLRVYHAPFQERLEGPECPNPAAVPSLSDATTRLQERMKTQLTLAETIAGAFEGYDVDGQKSEPVNDAAVMKTLAMICGGLALLSIATVFFAWRKRSWHLIDGLVALTAIVLVNLAGWLALGSGADQERLRANLFAQAATVFRETRDLTNSLNTLMLTARGGVLEARDSRERILADYKDYGNSLLGLEQLVRVWGRDVLTGKLDTGLISSERIQTRDDLLNSIRARTLTLYRQYAQLNRRLEDLKCVSEWFPRDRALEDALVALPIAP